MRESSRVCPACFQPQRWCDTPLCSWPAPPGHWAHLSSEETAACPGVLADPSNPPRVVSN